MGGQAREQQPAVPPPPGPPALLLLSFGLQFKKFFTERAENIPLVCRKGRIPCFYRSKQYAWAVNVHNGYVPLSFGNVLLQTPGGQQSSGKVI